MLNFTPYIRVALDSYVPSSFYLNRAIYDYEIIYLMEGELLISVDGQDYKCVPDDIIFLKPKKDHILKSLSNAIIHQPHIHFDFYTEENSPDVKVSFKKIEQMTSEEKSLFREDISEKNNLELPTIIRLKNPITIRQLLFEIIKEFDQKLPSYETAMQGLFLQLWSHLNREFNWQKNVEVQKHWDELQHLKAYLSFNLDKDLSLDDLEKIANISKYHLIRIFKEAYGITPIKYHQSSRIEKAKELAQYTNLSLNEISERIGFKSIHSFSRAFKNIEGVSPSFYRKK